MEKSAKIILFGHKETFAIQLGLNPDIEKLKLCFWVQGQKIGSFSKGGPLKYSIKAFKLFIDNKDSFYDSRFFSMSPTEIRKFFVDEMLALLKSSKKESQIEYEYREKFHLFFGPQFSNDGCFIKVLYNSKNVIIIYEPPKKLLAVIFELNENTFHSVFQEYINYCNTNNLI